MSFETNPRFLHHLLADAHAGRLQLPDFQRSYVWGDDDVRSLIGSILRGFPVGALLTLRSGGPVAFKPRLLEGVEAERNRRAEPPAQGVEELLLDGQQRITSLYGALMRQTSMTVRRPKSERRTVERFYYIDIACAASAADGIEDALLGVPQSRERRDETLQIDLSTRDKEFEAGCFPLNIVFDNFATMNWLWEFQAFWQARGLPRADLANAFMQRILQPLLSYQMPVIRLDHNTSREAVCLVFEKVNVGGKKLDAFELVTAIFAGSAEPLNLRDDWVDRYRRIQQGQQLQGMPQRVFDNLRGFDFLQAVSLLVTLEARNQAKKATLRELPQVSCRREALLGMALSDFRSQAPAVEEGFREAGRFLNEQKILWAADLPYPAQAVALAAVYAVCGRLARNAAAREKLRLWFWRTSLAEDYGSSPESKLAKDTEEVSRWLAGGAEPDRLHLLKFNPDRLESLKWRISAAYRAFAALLLQQGCRDFITGSPADILTFGNDPMDVHHVFPRAWCLKAGIPESRFDSIINKTPLTAASNREIGGVAPSDYLSVIERKYGLTPDQLDSILHTHLINPLFLRTNNFEEFYADRKRRLAGLAAHVTGLSVETVPQFEPEGEMSGGEND